MMTFLLKTCFKFLLAAALFIGVQQLVELKTRGFCLQKIQAGDLPHSERWETAALSDEESREVNSLLSQNYRFLGAGSECFAFLIEDGSTVIKFFKLDLCRPVYLHRGMLAEDHSHLAGTLSSHTLLKANGDSWINRSIRKVLGMREYRLLRTFTSIKLAYDHLKEETGILYLHLNPTKSLHRKMTLYDTCGIAHAIDLDSAKFFLQKKAVPIEKHLAHLKKNNEHSQAKECIDSLIGLILGRCTKGFADRDVLDRNLGFIGTKAIEIDSGSFIECARMKEAWIYKQEIFYATLELKEWLKIHYPELYPYLEEKVTETMIST